MEEDKKKKDNRSTTALFLQTGLQARPEESSMAKNYTGIYSTNLSSPPIRGQKKKSGMFQEVENLLAARPKGRRRLTAHGIEFILSHLARFLSFFSFSRRSRIPDSDRRLWGTCICLFFCFVLRRHKSVHQIHSVCCVPRSAIFCRSTL